MSLNRAQQEAVQARGNVLVTAGAGTGKTSTLVERCLHCLLHGSPPASLDEILVVTFTDAAAAEMRQRIRVRLEEQMAAHPADIRWPEQIALFETARIGTLHSFCLQLVRRHFYELELDPQLTVMAEEEAGLLAGETLDKILLEHYAGKTPNAEAVQQLIQVQGRGKEPAIRELVLQLHHYTRTLRNPDAWFEAQLGLFQSPHPTRWLEWLLRGVREWRDRWLPQLQAEPPSNTLAAACITALRQLPAAPSRVQCVEALDLVLNAPCPAGKKTAWRKPLEKFLDEAGFLASLARVGDQTDPLAEDWEWARPPMIALLELTREFSAAFADARRELGVVDFHDLEQHSLRLLWDRATGQPTAIARQWREQLRFVFVDEYQDINDAQDAILQALSRDADAANRFLVGDVKQSIYRFRLADPRIFQNYLVAWHGTEGCSIALADNFRSREAILNFVNSLFGSLMRREIGGVAWTEDSRLLFGDPQNRAALSLAADPSPRVELHLRLKSADTADDDHASEPAWAEFAGLEDAAREARLVALRLRELKTSGHLIWDKSANKMRPVEWSDMAVLMRSPSAKTACYAREFTRLGVPLVAARGGFYDSLEITDLLSLLQLLDNPLQDLPLLAVLHSPLVGMSPDDLAAIRLMRPREHLWFALQDFHQAGKPNTGAIRHTHQTPSPPQGGGEGRGEEGISPLPNPLPTPFVVGRGNQKSVSGVAGVEMRPSHTAWPRADRFLASFAAWRRLGRQVSISQCLEAVIGATHFAEWLLTLPRGDQRHANVLRFVALARQFDQFQRQGLLRFLEFIKAQQAADTEPTVAPVSGDDSVALMSIHQSKGLEFPVVALTDLGKPFNLSELREDIMLDEEFGLCPRIKPPRSGRRYPSLPCWLAQRRQRAESLGEELRLLYVAMTRARDTLILSGSLSEKSFHKRWAEPAGLDTASLLGTRNYLDWIAAWAGSQSPGIPSTADGENAWWRWTIYEELDRRLVEASAGTAAAQSAPAHRIAAAALRQLRERLAWQYPHPGSTRIPAKTSVTALRRRQADELDDEVAWLPRENPMAVTHRATDSDTVAATDLGTIHHLFLQWVALDQVGSIPQLQAESRRVVDERILTAHEADQLDFTALAAFWNGDLGRRIRSRASSVRRELAFTARFTPDELKLSGNQESATKDEFVVVQGVADLVVVLPEEIWLVDFKTDRIAASELIARTREYEPQLRLYALAFSRIYRRPVREAWFHFLALDRSVELGKNLQESIL